VKRRGSKNEDMVGWWVGRSMVLVREDVC
jgi:hypothetical protein